MRGMIVKGVGGLYTVWCEGVSFPCKARGRFRNENLRPEIGDWVEASQPAPGDDYGAIERILPRVNRMTRPSVVNIGLAFVTVSVAKPEPDLLLADKLIWQARMADIPVELLINKSDLGDAGQLAEQYLLCGFSPVVASAATGYGIDELLARMRGRVCAFCGQSGVGKSSLMNAVFGESLMQTGDMSRIERGRHTTRHVQLMRLEREDAWLADTPGFSLLEADAIDPADIKIYYPEYEPYEGRCRFDGCNHVSEPDCAVKQAVDKGALSRGRWERYARLYTEINEKWGRRYD